MTHHWLFINSPQTHFWSLVQSFTQGVPAGILSRLLIHGKSRLQRGILICQIKVSCHLSTCIPNCSCKPVGCKVSRVLVLLSVSTIVCHVCLKSEIRICCILFHCQRSVWTFVTTISMISILFSVYWCLYANISEHIHHCFPSWPLFVHPPPPYVFFLPRCSLSVILPLLSFAVCLSPLPCSPYSATRHNTPGLRTEPSFAVTCAHQVQWCLLHLDRFHGFDANK